MFHVEHLGVLGGCISHIPVSVWSRSDLLVEIRGGSSGVALQAPRRSVPLGVAAKLTEVTGLPEALPKARPSAKAAPDKQATNTAVSEVLVPDEILARLETEYQTHIVATSELVGMFDPDNPRNIEDGQLATLGHVLTTLGVRQPIVCNRRTGLVIGGHQRIRAAQAEGIEYLPVWWGDYSEDDARTLSLAFNAEFGTWAEDKLVRRLLRLKSKGVDLMLTGFTDDRLGELMTGWSSDIPDLGGGDPHTDATPGSIRITCNPSDTASLRQAITELVSELELDGVAVS